MKIETKFGYVKAISLTKIHYLESVIRYFKENGRFENV